MNKRSTYCCYKLFLQNLFLFKITFYEIRTVSVKMVENPEYEKNHHASREKNLIHIHLKLLVITGYAL